MGEENFPKRLAEGYAKFLNGRFPRERERFEDLAERGQSPEILLIGCCDSRVSPELIFDAGPGEMFVVRNVANLVPPYKPNDDYHGTSAAIEFAVMGLKVKHIVIMGHAQCGGVKAYAELQHDPYMRPLAPGDFIGGWIKLLAPAAEKIGAPTRAAPAMVRAAGVGIDQTEHRQSAQLSLYRHAGAARLAFASWRLFRRQRRRADGAGQERWKLPSSRRRRASGSSW